MTNETNIDINKFPYFVGAGKTDITCLVPGIGLLGWAEPGNVALEVYSRLYCRAFVLQDRRTGRKCAFVNVEICFPTISLLQGVEKIFQEKYPTIGLSGANIMLTANHTHSAPGGYTHYFYYNIPTPGYHEKVYNTLINGIAQALVAANERLTPACIAIERGEFSEDTPIAFNRSMNAFNQNPDVDKIPANFNHLAVDRDMTLLRFDSHTGEKIGAINWFGVHTTTIHSDKRVISSDTKGYAARTMEETLAKESPNFVSAFAQSCCGDVSPNYILHKGDKDTRGPTPNDFENERIQGAMQMVKAFDLYNKAQTPITGAIDYEHCFFDLSKVEIDPSYTNGRKGERTGEACFGIAFMQGTKEGGGASPIILSFLSTLARFRKLHNEAIHGKKLYFVECKMQRFFGVNKIDDINILPEFIHPFLKPVKICVANDAIGKQPFVPHLLPLQILVLGELAIVGIPGEPTTVAGRRIRQTVLDILAAKGVKQVITAGYANAYAGYVTTYEEYEVQRYEGGHTLFGKWTCAAYQTLYKKLANQLLTEPEKRTSLNHSKPYEFSQEELQKRAYHNFFGEVK